jgi:hypothetical protein
MIIDDFDRMRVLTMPAKTNAPLVIYANAVLSVPTTLERFEAIAGRQAHDLEPIGGIELKKLTSGNPLNVAWQATLPPKIFSVSLSAKLLITSLS